MVAFFPWGLEAAERFFSCDCSDGTRLLFFPSGLLPRNPTWLATALIEPLSALLLRHTPAHAACTCRRPVCCCRTAVAFVCPTLAAAAAAVAVTVTASEAGQQKRLLLLDTNWQQVDSIPINIGRKHYSLSTPAAAANAASSCSSSAGSSAAAAAADLRDTPSNGSESDQDPTLDAPAAEAAAAGVLQLDVEAIQRLLSEGVLRRGDLVHLRADQEDSSEAEMQQVTQALKDQGEGGLLLGWEGLGFEIKTLGAARLARVWVQGLNLDPNPKLWGLLGREGHWGYAGVRECHLLEVGCWATCARGQRGQRVLHPPGTLGQPYSALCACCAAKTTRMCACLDQSLRLPPSTDNALLLIVAAAAASGVQVQVHRAPSTRLSARIDAAEQLSMSQLLEVYAENVGMTPEVLQAARDALKVGRHNLGHK